MKDLNELIRIIKEINQRLQVVPFSYGYHFITGELGIIGKGLAPLRHYRGDKEDINGISLSYHHIGIEWTSWGDSIRIPTSTLSGEGKTFKEYIEEYTAVLDCIKRNPLTLKRFTERKSKENEWK